MKQLVHFLKQLLQVMLSIVLFPHWLLCRLTAERCPRCGSKWGTELVGEWDGEDWACHDCGNIWSKV